MKRVIAGATGLIGKALCQRWLAAGHELVLIGRTREKIYSTFGHRVTALAWNELAVSEVSLLKDAEVIINLAGANIANRWWSQKYRQKMISSRVTTTETLARYCARLGEQSPPLFNASAIGVYGPQNVALEVDKLPSFLDEKVDTESGLPTSFLAEMGRAWEAATQPARQVGVHVLYLRFGLVLARQGGFLPKIRLPVKYGLGTRLGTGQQPMSWIALDDVCRTIEFLLQQPLLVGPVNVVAPEAVTQAVFMKTLASLWNRSIWGHIPAHWLEKVLGPMATELLLTGQHVVPKRLIDMGFEFKYPTLKDALFSLLTCNQ